MRGEVDRLKHFLREGLGAELEAESSQSLRQRVDELTQANAGYRSENINLNADVHKTRAQLQVLEDDLTAARTSLRRMIKEQSQSPQT